MTQRGSFGTPVLLVDRSDARESDPVGHARAALVDALDEAGGGIEPVDHWTQSNAETVLVIGLTDDPLVRKLLKEDVTAPESVVFQWAETNTGRALVAAGPDERGLTYALYELADRVAVDGTKSLDSVEDVVESPDNAVRGVDRFITGPVQDRWLYDLDFWEYYFERLAQARFNRFVLIVGYDSPFMSPPYPFFVDVPEYPDVRVPNDIIEVSRDEHLELLRTVGRLASDYGLEFYFGIWQQRPDWNENQGILVEGLPSDPEEFADYCTKGLHRLLVACPEIGGVQLRINFEAGVGGSTYDSGSDVGPSTGTAEAFWREIIDTVKAASAERDCSLKLDIRAKGLTDAMIERALETGLDVTVPTKYWCESTGLPHHMSQMRREELDQLHDLNRSRRYGHADLLRKPRFYDVLYRLWVIGTNRIFLWGDPDYARRFSHSAGFGGATGFEITAPLSLKGGHFHLQDEWWPLFDDESLSDYEWEDERYWAWYLFFGRLGYSTDTDPDVWEREFRRRFGEAADPIQRGYRAASKVLPLLTAYHLTEHPALWNWAELDTGGALFAEHNINETFGSRIYYDGTYQGVEPSDPGLFYGIDEYVQDMVVGNRQPKYTPLQVRDWLRKLAAETRTAVDAGAQTGALEDLGEHGATRLDLLMLADLAEYHAAKIGAALALSYYQQTDNTEYLLISRDAAEQARATWSALSERGEGAYHHDLVFGMGPENADEGTWADHLPELDADVELLERMVNDEGTEVEASDEALAALNRSKGTTFPNLSFDLRIPDRVRADETIEVHIETGELNDHGPLTLHYRHTDQTEGPFRQIEMDRTDRGYRGTVPADYVVPEWDLQVYVSTIDGAGDTILLPGLYHAKYPEPYRVIIVEP